MIFVKERILLPIGIALLLTAHLGLSISSANAASSKKATPIAFVAQVWVDNWFSLYANGKKVGEDSVPITTERSFNAETIAFTATYPLTLGLIARDYIANDSGLEYIGTPRQQIGDGGIVMQVHEKKSGKLVAVTNSKWKILVIHRAPLNPECEKSGNPMIDCKSKILPQPKLWSTATFKDLKWTLAKIFTAEEVGVKDGYLEISWEPSAQLIWGSDLKLDNTILMRYTATGK